MSSLAFYVEQDDALLGVLTVKETINFAARLRYDAFHCERSVTNFRFLSAWIHQPHPMLSIPEWRRPSLVWV